MIVSIDVVFGPKISYDKFERAIFKMPNNLSMTMNGVAKQSEGFRRQPWGWQGLVGVTTIKNQKFEIKYDETITDIVKEEFIPTLEEKLSQVINFDIKLKANW